VTRKSVVNPGDTILVPERKFTNAEIASLVFGSAGALIAAASLVVVIATR
jgi:hypothetical protein